MTAFERKRTRVRREDIQGIRKAADMSSGEVNAYEFPVGNDRHSIVHRKREGIATDGDIFGFGQKVGV